MKSTLITALLLCVLAKFGMGQTKEVEVQDFKTISIKGIDWQSTRDDLLKAFGPPDTLFDPDYDCGFYSQHWQPEIKSVELFRYGMTEFLVVDNAVVLRNIYFDRPEFYELKTKHFTLSKHTTLIELERYFPNAFKAWKDSNDANDTLIRLLPCAGCDDMIYLHMEKGRIKRVQFWDPC